MEYLENKKAFIKHLESIDRSKHIQDKFGNFCEMAYCAIAKTTQIDEAKAQSLEDRYMEIVSTYQNKDDVRKMSELLTLAALSLKNGGCDFLGEIAGDINALDKNSGQFFTPYHVSKLMAKIQMPDIPKLIEDKGFFSLSDPAAGAGCMPIAAADCVEEAGYNPMDCMSVQAVELNCTTYYMLYVQLSLRGVAAEVIHGNSLSLETFNSQYTPAAVYFFGKHGRLFDPPEKNPENKLITLNSVLNAEQLSLFE